MAAVLMQVVGCPCSKTMQAMQMCHHHSGTGGVERWCRAPKQVWQIARQLLDSRATQVQHLVSRPRKWLSFLCKMAVVAILHCADIVV